MLSRKLKKKKIKIFSEIDIIQLIVISQCAKIKFKQAKNLNKILITFSTNEFYS